MTETESQPVIVTRLRDTTPLRSGRLRQIFDAVNFPGISVVCVTEPTSCDPRLVSQIYELDDGQQFTDADAAISAWQRAANNREASELLGEALRRLVRGLVRPLWNELTDDQKASWVQTAAAFARLLEAFGLRIVKAEEGANQ